MASKDTKERILDSAELLLAEHGFTGASVRAIASAADVNLASINYHFGSKEALVRAVFERHVGPINLERIALLDALEREAGDHPPSPEGIVEAFIHPVLGLRRKQEWHILRRFLGHSMSLPDGPIRDAFLDQFTDVVKRFTAALGRALPDLSEHEILWRLLFMVGTVVHTLAMADDMPLVSGGRVENTDPAQIARRLVPFIAAGLRAPAAGSRVEVGDA